MSTKIAPDDKSGYSSIDVLEDAQEDDDINIEFNFAGSSGVYGVLGRVVDVEESLSDDEETREKKIVIEAHDHVMFEGLILWVHSSTLSAYNYVIDKIDVRKGDTYPDWETRELGDVHGVELVRGTEDEA